MYRASMIDFIEERTGRLPDWNARLSVVGDHGGSGVGLHIHLESLDRWPAILEPYTKGAAKSP